MDAIQGSLFGKTSQERSAATGVLISGPCLKKSQRAKFQCLILDDGQPPEWCEGENVKWHGESSTRNTGESPSAVVVSSLSSILQDNVPEKYFLSPKACQGILRRAEKRGKKLPPVLEMALESQATGRA